jgi:Tol biopolymer transport system component
MAHPFFRRLRNEGEKLVRMQRTYLLLLGLGLYFSLQAGEIAWSQVTERVSVDSAGGEGNNASTAPSISSDGRYVAFESQADNLVAGDILGFDDIFVRDRQTPTTTRVSVDSNGAEGSGHSYSPSISGDGRYVAFESNANDLVTGDTNPLSDIFVHELPGGPTTLVSVDSFDAQDVPSSSFSPSISADGRYVAFDSNAILVADDTNGTVDIFVRDRDADENGTYDEPGPGGVSTVRVSVATGGGEVDDPSYSPSISSDGRHVAFESIATNLVAPVTNGKVHIFVRDLVAGTTTLVSVSSTDVQGNNDSSSPSISGDGRYVAFESLSTNLVAPVTNGNVHIFVRDLVAKTTTLVSVNSTAVQGNDDSSSASISSDGRYVAFESAASNLVAGDMPLPIGFIDIFVHDRDTDEDGIYDELGEVSTIRVSVDSAGVEGNGNSNAPSISGDGSSVTFQSIADNLVAGDTPFPLGFIDIFVDDLQAGAEEGGGSSSNSSSRWVRCNKGEMK